MSTPTVRDRAVVIDQAFAVLQRWGLRLVVLAAAVYVLGWIVGHLWMVFFPLSLALLVATVLAPPVTWLRRHKVPSGLAAALVMIGFIAAIVAAIAVLTPQVAGQAPAIASQASDGLQRVRDWLTDGPLQLSDGQITRAISAVQDKLQESAAAISSGIFSTLSAATNAVINLVLVLMLTFFFVKDGHRFLPWLATLGGRRAGEHVTELLSRTWNTLGGFIRTQTLVAFIDAVIIGIGLAILGVPLAIPLAVITFFGGYIPIVGAFVSGILAVLVTLVTNDFKAAVIAALIVLGVQQLEGNVLSPWLQGKNMNLHAGVVLLSVTAGGTLFGVTGAFLAVPVAATTAVLLRYVNEQIDDGVDPEAPPEDSHAAALLAEGKVADDVG
ncbi:MULTISPECIES: AI-2E family transporter [unclassified Aeromicrobium]|uniref:AI-2E family transporter n=1 Tax=unclassified Aeromicrobium TaxID=2633570 RepID=UPI00288A0F6E|nr:MULTISPECIES: AI-2E family transporter [unclassified Aeromicrobium]